MLISYSNFPNSSFSISIEILLSVATLLPVQFTVSVKVHLQRIESIPPGISVPFVLIGN